MFQSRQLVGMDLEIVHAKSNKPLVTIQDQVESLMLSILLVLLVGLKLMLYKPLVTIQDRTKEQIIAGINLDHTSYLSFFYTGKIFGE